MPSEAWSANPTPLNKSLESLKEAFKQRLDGILHKQLTVENISTFADEALEQTVKLTDEILKEYRENPNVHPNQIQLDKQKQEDEAFKILDLPNISEILQSIIEVKERIDALGKYINESNIVENKVLVPPQDDLAHGLQTGNGQGIEEKKLISRLITLLYILETDFDIKKEQVKITEGKVAPEMMRKTPYVRVKVPDIGRIVYICDEEGNASYVFDTDKLEEVQINIETLDISDKGIINDLIAQHPGIGARIIQTKHWRVDMTELLGNNIPEKIQEQTKLKSEFEKREKREWLPFDRFQEEVRRLYPGEGDVQRWYYTEFHEHADWPSRPQKKYENWISWPQLVGKESHLERKFIGFEDFKKEVLLAYPGEGVFRDWYKQERKQHTNWPSEPEVQYKDKGWTGWSGIFGFEDNTKKKFLDFETFSTEVRGLYPGEGSVRNWYKEERKRHPNWPSEPKLTYKGKGWSGFYSILGKENPLEKSFLEFSSFVREVRTVYSGQTHIEDWYKEEKERHVGWPAAPYTIYKDKGWIGWPELVGKERKEFLDFETFSAEVRGLYPPNGGNVQIWYHVERHKHADWPSSPSQYYKEKGWKDWSVLVGKENFKRRDFLPFKEFINEIKSLYPTNKPAIIEWYQKEKKSHKKWPALPYKFYKHKGWVNWRDIFDEK